MDHVMDEITADITVRDYVCSICWGHLIKAYRGGETIVYCPQHDGDRYGFVTKYYAEHARSESVADKLDAIINLKGIIPTEHEDKDEDQLLSELGF